MKNINLRATFMSVKNISEYILQLSTIEVQSKMIPSKFTSPQDICVFLCLRWTYQEFFSRYRVLMKQKDVLSDKKLTCKNVLEKLVQVRLSLFVLLLLTNKSEGYSVVSFALGM